MIEKFETDFFIVSGRFPFSTLIVKANNREEAISIAIEVWKEQGVLVSNKNEVIAMPLNAFRRK